MKLGVWITLSGKPEHVLRGMVTSSVGFSIKVGSTIGSGILGILMSMSGYISGETAAVQPDAAITMIKALFNYVTLIFSLIAFVISMKCTIDKDRAEMNLTL